MPRLVNNASGVAANTDPVNNVAPPIPNLDPVNVENNLLSTIYFWATTWDTAEVQIYIAPQTENAQDPVVWFPLLNSAGNPVVLSGANGYINFATRYGLIKGEVVNSSALTSGLTVVLFGPQNC